MKKFLPILLILSLVFCSFFTVSAVEIPNAVDAKNSGFEDATAINETAWYKLVDSNGSASKSKALFTGIEIKADGGHTGNNYLSTTITASWHSPSINVYPFIQATGADAYVLSFWYKSNKDIKISRFLFRALQADAYENGGEYQPDITARGSGNYYAELRGTSTNPDANGWRCFISNPIEVVAEQFDGEHNWWFCLDQLKATSDDPLILDIDDFVVCSELDFEVPEEPEDEKKELITDITYITTETISNAFSVATPEASTPAPEATEVPTDTPENDFDLTLTIILASAAFVVGAVATCVIIVIAKKKKK